MAKARRVRSSYCYNQDYTVFLSRVIPNIGVEYRVGVESVARRRRWVGFSSPRVWFSRKHRTERAEKTRGLARRLGSVALSFPDAPIDATRRRDQRCAVRGAGPRPRGATIESADMGACASRPDDHGVDAASHLEASPAGAGAATVKAELARPANPGCAFGWKRRGVADRTPASPASVEARGAASPVAADVVPLAPPLRPAGSRAPVPRTASGGRGGRGPGGGGGRGLGHAEGDADPDARHGFGFENPETERSFLGLTNERDGPDGPEVPTDANDAFGDALLALSSSRVRAWDAKEADTEAWRTYTELMAEARERQREKREAAEKEAREAAEAASVDAFVKHFPRRRDDPATKGASETAAVPTPEPPEHGGSRSGMSESESESVASSSRNEPSPPKVISALARLAAEATARSDFNWARREEVRAMLAEDVVYRTIEGSRVRGRDAVIEKMCESVEKVARRFRLKTSDTRQGGKAVPERASRVKVRSEGPTAASDEKGREIWIVHYAFDLLLVKIRVKETFRVDKTGVIKAFSRARA